MFKGRPIGQYITELVVVNGLRMLVGNLKYPGTGLLAMLEDARSQVLDLLQTLASE